MAKIKYTISLEGTVIANSNKIQLKEKSLDENNIGLQKNDVDKTCENEERGI